jgi:hypothetical protein
MTNFFGVIFAPSHPQTAQPAPTPKFFGVGVKTPRFSLRFCVADGAKGAQKGALKAL